MRLCVYVCCCVSAHTQVLHDSLLQQGDTCVCVFTCLWTRSLTLFSCTRCVCMIVFVYVSVCMCLCLYLCLYLCLCLRMHAVFHDSVLHSDACRCVCARVRACVCACVCACACACVCTSLRACLSSRCFLDSLIHYGDASVCVCVSMCVRFYVCACVRTKFSIILCFTR